VQAITKLKILAVIFYFLGAFGLFPLGLLVYTVTIYGFDPGASGSDSWPQALLFGGLLLIIGLLPIVVAILLSKKKKLGRIGALILGVIMIIAAAADIARGFSTSDSTKIISNFISLVVPVVIILLASQRDVAALLQNNQSLPRSGEQWN
jgi:uncharacterized membrane protein